MSGSGSASPYAWLPRGAREWSPPHGGVPGTWPRFTVAYALLVLLRITGDVPVPWLLGAAAVVGVASVAGYGLRRRCVGPRGGSWVVRGAGSASLVVPGGVAGAAVRTTVTGGGRVLGGAEAVAAVRGAVALLRSADRDPAALAAVGAAPKPDAAGTADGAMYVVYDERSAFVLRTGAARGPGAAGPGRKAERGAGRDRAAARQRQFLADVAGELGAEVPPADGAGPGDVPDALSPAGRGAESLAATAAAAAGAPLPDTDPDVRDLPWPAHRDASAAADGVLRLVTLAVPVALWAAWFADAWS